MSEPQRMAACPKYDPLSMKCDGCKHRKEHEQRWSCDKGTVCGPACTPLPAESAEPKRLSARERIGEQAGNGGYWFVGSSNWCLAAIAIIEAGDAREDALRQSLVAAANEERERLKAEVKSLTDLVNNEHRGRYAAEQKAATAAESLRVALEEVERLRFRAENHAETLKSILYITKHSHDCEQIASYCNDSFSGYTMTAGASLAEQQDEVNRLGQLVTVLAAERDGQHAAAVKEYGLRKNAESRVRELEAEVERLRSDHSAQQRVAIKMQGERDAAHAELARLSGASGCCVSCERLTLERDEALVKAGKYDHWCGLKRANGEPLRKGGPCACQFDMDYPDQPLGWCAYHANLRNERDKARNTLQRIATEFTALHLDSGQCDHVGEIYHLLREAGAIEEEEG